MKRPCRNASQASIIKMRELHPIPLITLYFNWMKTKNILLILTLFFMSSLVFGQKKTTVDISEILTSGKLPQSLELTDDLQKLVVTTEHFNSDIFGTFFNKIRVTGEYTRGLPNGKVKWNNVTIASSQNRESDYTEVGKVDYMEDFTYTPSAQMMDPDNYVSFTENGALTKNLIWDMMGIESFAWLAWNELRLNETYKAIDFNVEVDLAGQGSFENKDVRLLWSGITVQNGEFCAIIDYQTFNNPLEVSEGDTKVKGRSHYWGTIYVSLEDKQVEHAVLYEDVIMEVTIPGQPQKQLVDAVREISIKKVI